MVRKCWGCVRPGLQLCHQSAADAFMSFQTQGKYTLSVCLQQCFLWHLKVQKIGSLPLSNCHWGDNRGHGTWPSPVELSPFKSAREKDWMTIRAAPRQTEHFGLGKGTGGGGGDSSPVWQGH